MKRQVDMEQSFKCISWADVEFLVCRDKERIPGLGTELVRRAVSIMHDRGVKVTSFILLLMSLKDYNTILPKLNM